MESLPSNVGGTLFVAATPLGNLGDVSARLRATLAEVAAVWAEDTRRSRILLQHIGVRPPLYTLHQHNERRVTTKVLAHCQAGHHVALLSDAGTPSVSDPGTHLIATAHAHGVTISPIVGPSALTAALSVSGFEVGAHGALFLGFLPRKGPPRAAALTRIAQARGPVVLFESPERAYRTVHDIAQASRNRPICVCRELTKIHEEVRVSDVETLAAEYDVAPPRGELTFVLGPMPEPTTTATSCPSFGSEDPIAFAIGRLAQTSLHTKDVVTAITSLFDGSKQAIYRRVLAERQKGP